MPETTTLLAPARTRRKKRPAESSPIQAASQIARELSEELGDEVHVMNAEWIRYASEGLVVDLHLGRERYRLQLDLRTLGIEGRTPEETSQLKRLVKPGHVYLLPHDVIKDGDTLDSRARDTLKKHAYKTVWGFWLPRKKYAAWRADNVKVRDAYLAVVDTILADYDTHVLDAKTAYLGLLNRTWSNLARTAAGRRIPGIEDRATWVSAQLETMAAEIPSPQAIRDSYHYRWQVYSLPLQAQVEQDRVQAGELVMDAAQELMLEDIRATAEARAKGGVEEFLQNVRGQIETQICKAADACLEVLQSNQGRLGRNSSLQLKNLIKTVSEMVFWDDRPLDARMQALQRMLDTPNKKRDPRDVKQVLIELGAASRLILWELDVPVPRSAANLGIPDDLDELGALVTRSRSRVAQPDLLADLDELPALRSGSRRQAVEAGALTED